MADKTFSYQADMAAIGGTPRSAVIAENISDLV